MDTKEVNNVNTPLIISDGCCVHFGSSPALESVNFSINRGKKVAVVGPNGGGKSTLFNALAGLIPLTEGSLTIEGKSPDEARGKVSYVPQRDLINWNFPLSVKQVVEMGVTTKKLSSLFNRKKVNDKIKKALQDVGLEEKINHNIKSLSGGQLQRVGIARALYNDPKILIFDESTSALDHETELEIIKNIYKFKRKKTLIIVTHKKELLKECDKIYKLENGKFLQNA